MAGSTQAFPSLSRGPGGCTDPPLGAGLCPCPPPPLRLVDFERANTYPCGKVLTGLKNHREWSPMPLPREEHRGVGT